MRAEESPEAQAADWRDDYELGAAIGAGGAAKVYRATRKSDGQRVALKIMRVELAGSEEERERLRREVMAVRSIESPNVCSIFDFDVVGDEPFIVMEYLEGITLRQVMAEQELPPKTLSLIIGQVAEALHEAHQKGIVHRDLKPENIMLCGPANARIVKVLDFGMAKLLDHEERDEIDVLTRVGTTFGTPQYISPEQVRGRDLDGRADLFALAVVAYEMIAGSRPWSGKDPGQVMMAVITKEPPPLPLLQGEMGDRRDALQVFFQSALAKERDERPATARDFFSAFETALGLREASSEPPPPDFFAKMTITGIRDILAVLDPESPEDDMKTIRLPSARLRCLPLPAESSEAAAPIPAQAEASVSAKQVHESAQSAAPSREAKKSKADLLFPQLPDLTDRPGLAGETLNLRVENLDLSKKKAPVDRRVLWGLCGLLVGVAMSAAAFFLGRM